MTGACGQDTASPLFIPYPPNQLNCLDHYTHAIKLWSITFHVWPLRRLHLYSNKLWRMWPTRFSSDWKKGVNYSLILSKFKYYIKKGKANLQHFPLLNKTLNRNFFISLLFHLFFLILNCSCPHSCNLMLTATCMFRPYIY
jgi:hypothetical protein